jgi:hypothetical protein
MPWVIGTTSERVFGIMDDALERNMEMIAKVLRCYIHVICCPDNDKMGRTRIVECTSYAYWSIPCLIASNLGLMP